MPWAGRTTNQQRVQLCVCCCCSINASAPFANYNHKVFYTAWVLPCKYRCTNFYSRPWQHWKCKSRYISVLCTCNSSRHGKSTTSEKVLHIYSNGNSSWRQLKSRENPVQMTEKYRILSYSPLLGKVFHSQGRDKSGIFYNITTFLTGQRNYVSLLLCRPKIRKYHSNFPFTFPVYIASHLQLCC